jgi:hypothetical protein
VKTAFEKRGFSIVEAILALTLLALLVTTLWSFLARHRQVGIDLAQRADGLETVRTIAWLLRTEIANGRPGLDWEVHGGDSLTLRAFRGLALIRAGSPDGVRVGVCFRGFRSPAPEKDSVLLLGPDGRWRAINLEDRVRSSSPCSGVDDGWVEEWVLSQGIPGAVLARLFESGSYHFTGWALRYRRGEGGRQPLTPETIETGSFRVGAGPGSPFGWEITLRPPKGRVGVPTRGEPRIWRGG